MANETTTTNTPPTQTADVTTADVNTSKTLPKSRYAMLLLYPDNERHLEYITNLMCDVHAVGILHDKDVKTDPEDYNDSDVVVCDVHYKKPHYHFVYVADNSTTLGGFQKRFPNLEGKFIELGKCLDKNGKPQSERKAMRYLLHLDNPEKTPYPQNSLVGNVKLAQRYVQTVDNQSEQMIQILDFIETSDSYLKLTDVVRYVHTIGAFSTWCKLQHTFTHALREHNQDVTYSPTLASTLE